jgi:hypothetical protein
MAQALLRLEERNGQVFLVLGRNFNVLQSIDTRGETSFKSYGVSPCGCDQWQGYVTGASGNTYSFLIDSGYNISPLN